MQILFGELSIGQHFERHSEFFRKESDSTAIALGKFYGKSLRFYHPRTTDVISPASCVNVIFDLRVLN